MMRKMIIIVFLNEKEETKMKKIIALLLCMLTLFAFT